jgi:hypothetical protein
VSIRTPRSLSRYRRRARGSQRPRPCPRCTRRRRRRLPMTRIHVALRRSCLAAALAASAAACSSSSEGSRPSVEAGTDGSGGAASHDGGPDGDGSDDGAPDGSVCAPGCEVRGTIFSVRPGGTCAFTVERDWPACYQPSNSARCTDEVPAPSCYARSAEGGRLIMLTPTTPSPVTGPPAGFPEPCTQQELEAVRTACP